MIRLIAALATARDGVDRAIAYGEAVPRLERMKSMAICGLIVACFILSVAYINLNNHISDVEKQQRRGDATRSQILAYLQDADKDRTQMLKELAGK